MKAKGYAGRVLRVDLTRGEVAEQPLDEGAALRFIGGRGLGAKLLLDECPRGADPLGPENPLIFVTGPLEGTRIPTASRYGVAAKSPLTGIYGYSVAGGFWGPRLKASGFDAVIVTGRSRKPVHLLVDDDGGRILDASELWGLGTFETQRRLTRRLGDKVKTACIGPAGEAMVKFAAVISETRALGRCGVGAVMGSKRLKAVTVGGSHTPEIAHPERVRAVTKRMLRQFRAHPFSASYLGDLGTPGNTAIVQRFQMLPTRNFQDSVFQAAENVSGEHLNEAYVVRKRVKTCFLCPMACARMSRAKTGPYRGETTEGPEYETIWSLGPNCGNDDLSSIIHFDRLCDDLGLDTMSTGSVLAFAMECFEKGLLAPKDTHGLDLAFGRADAMEALILEISRREGLGDLLAEGTRSAARKLGGRAGAFAMQVKGLELGGYDPRGAKGLGLVYATGNRGGCHHASGYILPDEWKSEEGRFRIERKAEMVRDHRNVRMLFDSGMLCTHGAAPLGLETYGEVLSSVIGHEFDEKSLHRCAERINCTERAFNVREGVTRKDDTLPERLLKDGTDALPPFGRDAFDRLLDAYYHLSGWDSNGIPRKSYVEQLGLGDLDMEPALDHDPEAKRRHSEAEA